MAGMASTTPVHLMPTWLASSPSPSDATGLLPAQAIAHTAITLASCAGPARVASTVRVAELATRHITPAPNAAKKVTGNEGDSTNSIMQPARIASAVAASLTEGSCKDGRNDPRTVPAP